MFNILLGTDTSNLKGWKSLLDFKVILEIHPFLSQKILKKDSTSQNRYHFWNYWVYGIQIDTHINETIDNDIIDMVIANAITAWARNALVQLVTKKQ